MAQSVEGGTLCFPSGLDLKVVRQRPPSAQASPGSLLQILPSPCPPPHLCALSLSL